MFSVQVNWLHWSLVHDEVEHHGDGEVFENTVHLMNAEKIRGREGRKDGRKKQEREEIEIRVSISLSRPLSPL